MPTASLKERISEWTTVLRRVQRMRVGIMIRGENIVCVKYNPEREYDEPLSLGSHAVFVMDPTKPAYENLDKAFSKLPRQFFKDADVNLCIPFRQVSVQKMLLPSLDRKEIELAIENSIDVETELCEYKNLGEIVKNEKIFLDINVFKTKRAEVQHYIDVCQKYGIHLAGATCEPIAMWQYFKMGLTKETNYPFMLADLDANNLKLYVIVDNMLHYFRNVSMGYLDLVKALSRKIRVGDDDIEVTPQQAMQILGEKNLYSHKPNKSDELPYDRLFFHLRGDLEKVVMEIKKNINFFEKQSVGVPVDHLMLMGDFSKVSGIGDYFRAELDMSVEDVEYTDELKNANPKGLVGREEKMCWAMAVGLKQKTPSSFSLLPKEYIEKHLFRVVGLCAILANVLLLVVLASVFMNLQGKITELRKDQQAQQEQLRKFSGIKQNLAQKGQVKPTTDPLKVQFVRKQLKKNPPVDDLVYDLNRLAEPGMTLTSLSVNKGSLNIEGVIAGLSPATILVRYVKQLEDLTYVDRLVFEIKQDPQKGATFDIKGVIKSQP